MAGLTITLGLGVRGLKDKVNVSHIYFTGVIRYRKPWPAGIGHPLTKKLKFTIRGQSFPPVSVL